MRKEIILSVPLVLASCTSIPELQKQGPDATFSSRQDSNTVAACIAQSWQSHNKLVSSTPLAHGTRVNMTNSETNYPIAFVDVTQDGGHTLVSYYKGGGFTSWSKDDVAKCL